MAVVVLASAGLAAQSPAPPTVDQLAWLAGCWQMTTADSTVDEQWMAPRGGVMFGMGRTVRGGKVISSEFLTLHLVDGRIVYDSQPSGQMPASFAASTVAADRAVFENPTHDYPKRIAYRSQGADRLAAWIDDGTGAKRIDYTYRRAACER